MSDDARCDVCHRLVSMFVLMIEANPPYRMLCSYCRFDRDHAIGQADPNAEENP